MYPNKKTSPPHPSLPNFLSLKSGTSSHQLSLKKNWHRALMNECPN
ncbi:hypothetical protein J655_0104 [Acinetobacter sp. 1294243]|nr:hypothetical protein J655_0104 [Acinetobacter sp. 1294243]